MATRNEMIELGMKWKTDGRGYGTDGEDIEQQENKDEEVRERGRRDK